jgi:hypothetical protein
MLGSEFLTLARFLDWSEVKLRKTFQWCRSWWRHSGLVARASVIVLGCLLVGGGAYGGYVFFMKA